MRYFLCFLVLGVVRLVDPVLGVTTATPLVPSSAPPTTLMRFIQVRRKDFDINNPTEDIFNTKPDFKSRRRMRALSKIWLWDYWCLLQPRSGNCGQNKTKYYYNMQLDQCMTFKHTGCDRSSNSNKNRFDSVADCEQRCKGASMMSAINKEANFCELQADPGRCLGSHEMYYYDVNEAACKKFMYGGCGGNSNNFETMQKCLDVCKNAARTRNSNSDSNSDSDIDSDSDSGSE